MANEIRIIVGAVDNASKVMRTVSDSARSMGDDVEKASAGMRRSLDAIRPGLIAVQAGLAALAGASIKAASDLNEAGNAMRVTFGASAKVIDDFAATSAQAFGVSKRAAFEYSATLGAILKASGLSEEASAKMSTEIVGLAADLGSFKTLKFDDALEKIRAGLVGEVEPLRSVGVLLSADAVKAKAMQMGLIGAKDAMTEGQKVLARYQLILEQTNDAQGDFGRTLGESLPNQAKAARAELENAAGSLGQTLTPLATDAAKAVNGLAQAFSAMPDPAKAAAVQIGAVVFVLSGVVTVAGPAVAAIKGVTGALVLMNAALLASPIGLAALAVALTVGGTALLAYATLNEFAKNKGNEFASDTQKALAGTSEEVQAAIANFQELKSALEAGITTFQAAGKNTADLEKQVADLDGAIRELQGAANTIPGAMAAASTGMANAAADAERLTARMLEGAAAIAAMNSAAAMAAVSERERMFPSGSEDFAGRGDPGSFPALTGTDAVKKLLEDSRRAQEAIRNSISAGGGSGGVGGSASAASAANPLQDAIAAIQSRFNRDLSDAFVKGGESAMTKLAIAQSFIRKQISDTASTLMEKLGVDLPAALGFAADSILGAASDIEDGVKKLARNDLQGFIGRLASRRSAIGLNAIEGFGVRSMGGQPITINRSIGVLNIAAGVSQQDVVNGIEATDAPLLRQVRQSFAMAR